METSAGQGPAPSLCIYATVLRLGRWYFYRRRRNLWFNARTCGAGRSSEGNVARHLALGFARAHAGLGISPPLCAPELCRQPT